MDMSHIRARLLGSLPLQGIYEFLIDNNYQAHFTDEGDLVIALGHNIVCYIDDGALTLAVDRAFGNPVGSDIIIVGQHSIFQESVFDWLQDNLRYLKDEPATIRDMSGNMYHI